MAFFNKGMDGSDKLGNEGLFIDFYSVHVGYSVQFKGFLVDFSDTFDSKWTQDHVFGRNDPIATFQGTSRRISLSWRTPASSEEEAKDNLMRIGNLSKLLYPAYDGTSPGTLSASPTFRVKFGNLIAGQKSGQHAKGGGLFCFISNFSFKPQIDNGFYISSDAGESGITYYPKIIDLSCQLNIVHEHALGFESSTGKAMSEKFASFPYQVDSTNYKPLSAAFWHQGPDPQQSSVINSMLHNNSNHFSVGPQQAGSANAQSDRAAPTDDFLADVDRAIAATGLGPLGDPDGQPVDGASSNPTEGQ